MQVKFAEFIRNKKSEIIFYVYQFYGFEDFTRIFEDFTRIFEDFRVEYPLTTANVGPTSQYMLHDSLYISNSLQKTDEEC